MMLRLPPPYPLAYHVPLLLQHLPVILQLQKLSSFAEIARAPVLEVSDEDELTGAARILRG